MQGEVLDEVWVLYRQVISHRVWVQGLDVYSMVGTASIVEMVEYDMSAVDGGVTDVSE